MAKNRTMAAKNAKARKESMLIGKGYQMREMARAVHTNTVADSAWWNIMHIPDYSAKPRKAKVLNYAGRILV